MASRFTCGLLRGTNTTEAVRQALSDSRAKREADPTLEKPEIVVVSDGDDCLNMTAEDLGDTKLHVVMCATGHNESFSQLSKATGGVYMHVEA